VRPDWAPLTLDNGISLLGYDRAGGLAAGQTVQISLHWRVEALPSSPPAQGYSFANHVLAANGERVGQRDGEGYPVAYWRGGDTLVSWFEIPIDAGAAPGPYVLRTGMYVYTPPDQFAPVYVLDPTGQPIADAVEWALE
jgi:hypothetical protein